MQLNSWKISSLSLLKRELSRLKLEAEPTFFFPNKGKLFNVMLIVAGSVLVLLGITLTIAWIAFCFGSVVVGVLLLIFARIILILPLMIFSVVGWDMVRGGINNLNGREAIKKDQNVEVPLDQEARMRQLRKEYNLPEPKIKNLKHTDDDYTDAETIRDVNTRIDEIYEQHEHNLTEAKSKKKNIK